MSRLVISDRLQVAEVTYRSDNEDWAKIFNPQTGEESFIHVYEKGTLHVAPHLSVYPIAEVVDRLYRPSVLQVPHVGALVCYLPHQDNDGRDRAAVWVTKEEWLKAIAEHRRQKWLADSLSQGLTNSAEQLQKLFMPDEWEPTPFARAG